jgi:POT family proton-dependent oligopeptide transporter
MNRTFFGWEPTASQLTSVPAVFIIVLSPLFAMLWPALDRAKLNPSTAGKFGLGLVFAGLSMFILAWSATHPEANGKAGLGWFVFAYLVLVLGEMVLSPVGLSAVTTLSVPRVVSLMMGVWFLASAFGEMLAGRFGTLAAMEANTPIPEALAKYAEVFQLLGWVGAATGVGLLVITPLLKRLENANPAAQKNAASGTAH